ncbi:glycosyltransferase family 2 protein [Parafilimonas sp.]|uniref:glycosyltransferase family 2 protein n=1 Tax=Parafilimonas sp. TaxID=1969739 RepID=UPI0039E2D16E
MNEYQLTASIVLYKNDDLVKQAIESFLKTTLKVKLYLVDNSPTRELQTKLAAYIKDKRIEYIFNGANIGFGAGHNVAIKKIIETSAYHLVLNPDVSFDAAILPELLHYMQAHNNVGVVMPKVLYPDNSVQYLAKLLPRPFDFFVIRFLPFAFKKSQDVFRLKQSGYNKIMNVPFLSGCFLIFNTGALKKAGLFDEKIFMYTEDIDIVRRIISSSYKSVFYPYAHIYHHHERKSFKNLKVFGIYLKSALYYFNKWGWFFDAERRKINRLTLDQLKQS